MHELLHTVLVTSEISSISQIVQKSLARGKESGGDVRIAKWQWTKGSKNWQKCFTVEWAKRGYDWHLFHHKWYKYDEHGFVH